MDPSYGACRVRAWCCDVGARTNTGAGGVPLLHYSSVNRRLISWGGGSSIYPCDVRCKHI